MTDDLAKARALGSKRASDIRQSIHRLPDKDIRILVYFLIRRNNRDNDECTSTLDGSRGLRDSDKYLQALLHSTVTRLAQQANVAENLLTSQGYAIARDVLGLECEIPDGVDGPSAYREPTPEVANLQRRVKALASDFPAYIHTSLLFVRDSNSQDSIRLVINGLKQEQVEGAERFFRGLLGGYFDGLTKIRNEKNIPYEATEGERCGVAAWSSILGGEHNNQVATVGIPMQLAGIPLGAPVLAGLGVGVGVGVGVGRGLDGYTINGFEEYENAAKRARLEGYGGDMSPFNALEQAAFFAYAPYQQANSLGGVGVALSGQATEGGVLGGAVSTLSAGGDGLPDGINGHGVDPAEQTAVLGLLNARTKRELSRLGLSSNPGSFQNLPSLGQPSMGDLVAVGLDMETSLEQKDEAPLLLAKRRHLGSTNLLPDLHLGDFLRREGSVNTSDLATNGNQPTPTHNGVHAANKDLEAEGPNRGPAPDPDETHIGGPQNGTGGGPGGNNGTPARAVSAGANRQGSEPQQGLANGTGTGGAGTGTPTALTMNNGVNGAGAANNNNGPSNTGGGGAVVTAGINLHVDQQQAGGPSPTGPRAAALLSAIAAVSAAEPPRGRQGEAAAATPRSGVALDATEDEKNVGVGALLAFAEGEEPPRAASVLQTSATPIPNPIEAAQQAAALAAAVSLPNGESYARLAGNVNARMSGSMGGPPIPAAPTPPPPSLPHHLLGAVNGSASMGAPSPVMGGLMINSGLMTSALAAGRGTFGSGPILTVPPASQVPVYDKQVHDWCCRNGLQSVAHYLHYHKVDWPTLPYLTYEDLKEVGILHVGQRRKVMVALDELIEQLHRRGGSGAGYRR